jgi:hypothetical protein
MNIQVGSKLFFEKEVKPYTVKAYDGRFAICTKPFNLRKTVMYTIVDLEKQIRGTENLIFCMGFEETEDCENALQRLREGDSEISHRNRVPLDIVRVIL